MKKLLAFISRLEECKIAYRLSCIRPEAVMVTANVPGEHWEIEFFEDDSVEIERYKSDGEIFDESALEEFFSKYSD